MCALKVKSSCFRSAWRKLPATTTTPTITTTVAPVTNITQTTTTTIITKAENIKFPNKLKKKKKNDC